MFTTHFKFTKPQNPIQCEQMLLVFFLGIFAEARRRSRRRRSSLNEDALMRDFKDHLSEIADQVAKDEVKKFHERKHNRQVGRIFKSAMLAKMGVPWKEIIAAVPELIDKTSSMFAPNIKATNEGNIEQMKKWLQD